MARCFLVGGRVQGVCFRAATREQARLLGISGSAINLDDGRVRVIASGSDAALASLERWLWQGPPAARVDTLERSDWPQPVADGFSIG